LSLDKWLKPDKKTPKKNPEEEKKKEITGKKSIPDKPKTEKTSIVLIKFKLTCPNKRCNYSKIKVKKQLSERDKICPKCKGQMNVKQV
jgi:hypothetical protein